MAQAFVSIYKTHYRWNSQPKREPILPNNDFFANLPEGDNIWYNNSDDINVEQQETNCRNLAESEDMVRAMYAKRMRSSYQIHYCKSDVDGLHEKNKHERDNKNHKENLEEVQIKDELLEYCKKLYEPPQEKKRVLPTLPSSSKINGYMRPSRMYTSLTHYQYNYGKPAYHLMYKKKMKTT